MLRLSIENPPLELKEGAPTMPPKNLESVFVLDSLKITPDPIFVMVEPPQFSDTTKTESEESTATPTGGAESPV